MKNIGVFHLKIFSFFGGEIYNIFELACFRNELDTSGHKRENFVFLFAILHKIARLKKSFIYKERHFYGNHSTSEKGVIYKDKIKCLDVNV